MHTKNYKKERILELPQLILTIEYHLFVFLRKVNQINFLNEYVVFILIKSLVKELTLQLQLQKIMVL